MKYHSKILEDLENKMNLDPWYIKLYRWFKLQKWIIYCYLFNNKYVRRIKK